jgi:hypothetical protein
MMKNNQANTYSLKIQWVMNFSKAIWKNINLGIKQKKLGAYLFNLQQKINIKKK